MPNTLSSCCEATCALSTSSGGARPPLATERPALDVAPIPKCIIAPEAPDLPIVFCHKSIHSHGLQVGGTLGDEPDVVGPCQKHAPALMAPCRPKQSNLAVAVIFPLRRKACCLADVVAFLTTMLSAAISEQTQDRPETVGARYCYVSLLAVARTVTSMGSNEQCAQTCWTSAPEPNT